MKKIQQIRKVSRTTAHLPTTKADNIIEDEVPTTKADKIEDEVVHKEGHEDPMSEETKFKKLH
jgi:hypothetical protein